MGYELTIKRGDLAPDVELTVTDENDLPVDLSGAAVTFSMVNCRKPGTSIIDDKAGVLVNAAQGKIAYRWETGDTDHPAGTYIGTFNLDPAVGDDMTVPTIGKVIVHIEDRAGD